MDEQPDDLEPSELPPEQDTWEGAPVQLEGQKAEAETPAAEETLDQPVEGVPPPAPLKPFERWTARWLMAGGAGAAALALIALLTAFLQGPRPGQWQGALLALDTALILLLARVFVVGGLSLKSLSHGAFSILGIVASGYALQTTVLGSAARFIQGEASPEFLSELLVFGLLGLAGLIVFVQCFRGRSWACRTAAVAAVAFVLLCLIQGFRSGLVFGYTPAPPGLPAGAWWPLLAVCVVAAGALPLLWDWARQGARLDRRRVAAPALCTLALLAGAALLARTTAGVHDAPTAVALLWRLSAAWQGVTLLPLAALGLGLAWRNRHTLRTDMVESTRFAWFLVVLGGLACLALWLPTGLSGSDGSLQAAVLACGVGAVMLGAWLGATKGDWVSRWSLLPAVLLAVAALSSLDVLLDLRGPTGPWGPVVGFLWSSLVVGLVFAAAGIAVVRRRLRREEDRSSSWSDLHSLATTGTWLSVTALWVVFSLAAGTPAVAEGLTGTLQTVGAHVQDGLTLALGTELSGVAIHAAERVYGAWAGSFEPAASGILFILLAAHVLATSRSRWSAYLMASLWWLPLLVLAALTISLATRLFFPLEGPVPATAAGRFVASHFPARLALVAIAAIPTGRLGEAYVAVVGLCRREKKKYASPLLEAESIRPAGSPGRSHLVFLVRLGMVLAAVGLVGAVAIHPGPAGGNILVGLGRVGRAWARGLAELTFDVGGLTADWAGYGVAAGLVVYMLVGICYEARRGRVSTYPLLGVFWVLLVAYLGTGWLRAFRASGLSRPVLAASAAPVVVLAGATAAVWMRWWRLAGKQANVGEPVRDGGSGGRSASSLGTLGLVLCGVGTLLLLHGFLRTDPAYAERAGRWLEGARSVLDGLVDGVARRTVHAGAGESAMTALLLALAAGAVLIVHMLARHESRTFRAVLCALWFAAVAVGVGAGVYALVEGEPGRLDAARLLGGFAVAVVMVRAAMALVNAPLWMTSRER
ncbi:MAG: hypothetical protein R6X33_00240 [Candidatus Brocadiia bacterium]